MKIKTARSMLSITWVIGSVPLFIVIPLQSFNQVYGDEQNWDKGWLWIMPLLFPILGTIIGSWSVGENEVDDFEVASTSVFWMTMILSVVYFAILGRNGHWRCYIQAFELGLYNTREQLVLGNFASADSDRPGKFLYREHSSSAPQNTMNPF